MLLQILRRFLPVMLACLTSISCVTNELPSEISGLASQIGHAVTQSGVAIGHAVTQSSTALKNSFSSENSKNSNASLNSESGQGALLGAALGGVFGALLCDDNKAKCALAGVAVGGSLGYVVGSDLQRRRQQAGSVEQYYQAQIEGTRDLNVQLKQSNRALEQRIAKDRAEVKRLVSRYKKGQAKRNQLRKKKQQIDTQFQGSRKNLAALRREHQNQKIVLREMKNDGESSQARTLGKEIKTLENEIAQYDTALSNMSKQSGELGRYI